MDGRVSECEVKRTYVFPSIQFERDDFEFRDPARLRQ